MQVSLHLLSLLAAFGITLAVIPWVIRASVRAGLLDHPDEGRRQHKVAVPRLGGVAVFAATAITGAMQIAWSLSTSTALPHWHLLTGIALGSTIVFCTGLLDDLKGVPPVGKLLAQSAAALCVIGFGFQIDSIAFSPVSGALDLGILSLPVTVLWIVGMTNAFNLIDGVDGLAGTMATIALTVSIGVGIFLLPAGGILIPTAVLGAIFGFLRFNTSPARIFLGDSGSMTLGFFLSISLVLSSTSQETGATYAAIPLFALAFPLLDTFIPMARRWLRGHPFSRADGRHVHHQLLGLGLTARQTVDLLGIFFFATAGLGVSLVFAPPRFTVALILAAAVLGFAAIFYGTRWLRYGEFAELGASVLSVFRNARLVVREKIRANEIAEEIRSADSLEEVREILASLVDDVRLLDVEIVAGEVRFHSPGTAANVAV